MKKTIVTICLIFIAISAYADNFSIGGKEITIPPPKGFSRVTQQMTELYRVNLQLVDGVHDKLAYYIPKSDIPAALAGEIPFYERCFILMVNKEVKNMVVGSDEFSGFKNIIKQQNKELWESVKSEIPDLEKESSGVISKAFDVDVALQLSPMLPLDHHYEADNAISYSMYIKGGVSVKGTKEVFISSITLTFVNVSGRVLSLYCYGSKEDIEWTRSASKAWTNMVIDSNTQPPVRSSKEQK